MAGQEAAARDVVDCGALEGEAFDDPLPASASVMPHVRFLNRVAVSRTEPLALATNSCVRCVQLWKVSLLQPYVVSRAKRE
jgi:hypothetical protein